MARFNGFPKGMVTFFENLEKNNDKKWFEAHKAEYEALVKQPAGEFVTAMGEKLEKIAPDIHAIPKVNKSLFRINRDTRFSNDKRPYKTNLGIWFWEGDGKRMECSGFYFHYFAKKLMLGVGIHMMPKDILDKYRKAVVHDTLGPELRKAVTNVKKKGYRIGVKHYKQVPRGFEKSHDNAEYLLYSGLTAMIEQKVDSQFHSKEMLSIAFGHFKKMKPIHDWLLKVLR